LTIPNSKSCVFFGMRGSLCSLLKDVQLSKVKLSGANQPSKPLSDDNETRVLFLLIVSHYVTLYGSNVTEDEYLKEEGQNFIDKLFGGNAKNLLTALCRYGKLVEDDIEELKTFFKMSGEGK